MVEAALLQFLARVLQQDRKEIGDGDVGGHREVEHFGGGTDGEAAQTGHRAVSHERGPRFPGGIRDDLDVRVLPMQTTGAAVVAVNCPGVIRWSPARSGTPSAHGIAV
ncbi:hypothetical protein GCM10022207_46180 [Streptomyces lannensis]|uniref:Uncharacterized protein n=1 Tax=Streptomyces lannensis TaxID=766498 RepID=A0ABP7KGP3_9ACTN